MFVFLGCGDIDKKSCFRALSFIADFERHRVSYDNFLRISPEIYGFSAEKLFKISFKSLFSRNDTHVYILTERVFFRFYFLVLSENERNVIIRRAFIRYLDCRYL